MFEKITGYKLFYNHMTIEMLRKIFDYDQKISDCVLHKNWVQKVRNAHMHVAPVKSLTDAKAILAKTAYWLLRIIDELEESDG